jgi:fructose-specific phosphotransferase system IIA component
MNIEDLFNKECIDLNFRVVHKEDALRKMALMLQAEGRISDLDQFLEDIFAREESVSTGVGFGVAIPHAISAAVLSPSIAVAKTKDGLDFNAIDDELVHLIFMLAIPKEVENDEYIRTLAKLARLLVNEEFRMELMNVKDKAGFIYAVQKASKMGRG